MCASGWLPTLLLMNLAGAATSSPVSTHTSAPTHLLQISPPSPSPTIHPSLRSPSLNTPPPNLPPDGGSGASPQGHGCSLTVSPPALVVRYGEPVTANCSVQRMDFILLGWEVILEPPEATKNNFVVWKVERMTEWSIKPVCYIMSDLGEPCHIHLPITVYKPPDNVSISFVNHSGPLLEGHQYTLQCTVQGVAPVDKLNVTFYKGQTPLIQHASTNSTGTSNPVTAVYTTSITPDLHDDGQHYWCEAKLELGPEGPQHTPVVISQQLTATVHYGPQLVCSAKLQVREGERLSCEVRGNPPPLVTWFREGQAVALPAHSSREHAGTYTVLAEGLFKQKNFTVEVEVLFGRGSTNDWDRHFLLAVLLMWMMQWL